MKENKFYQTKYSLTNKTFVILFLHHNFRQTIWSKLTSNWQILKNKLWYKVLSKKRFLKIFKKEGTTLKLMRKCQNLMIVWELKLSRLNLNLLRTKRLYLCNVILSKMYQRSNYFPRNLKQRLINKMWNHKQKINR